MPPARPRLRLALAASLLLCGCGTSAEAPPRPADLDTDGDGILDVHESTNDVDGDGRAAFEDVDSDDDGIPDAVEAGDDDLDTPPVDSDLDRIPDTEDTDSDGNGIPDTVEAFGPAGGLRDRDDDGIIDSSDLDDDGDTVPDVLELDDGTDRHSGGSPAPDRLDPDSDGDGIGDRYEAWCAGTADLCDTDGDGVPDLLDDDSDGDGLPDSDESGLGPGQLDQPPRDLDGDEVPDFRDRDRDGDGISDADEVSGTTDPDRWDTDDDGLADGVEATLGHDPTDPASRWQGLIVEVEPRADGASRTTVALDSGQVDIVFSEHAGSIHTWSAPAVHTTLDHDWADLDVAAAITSTGTYATRPYGCRVSPLDCGWAEEDLRLIEGAQVAVWAHHLATTDLERLSEGFSVGHERPWWIQSGGYDALALHESMVQITTGRGYDLDCDGEFDEHVDLAPWPQSPDDLFSGTGRNANPRYGERLGPVGTLGLRERSHKIWMDVRWAGAAFANHVNVGHPPDPLGAPELDVLYEGPADMCPAPATHADAVEALRTQGFELVLPPAWSCTDWASWPDHADPRTCAEYPDALSWNLQLHAIAKDLGSGWDPDGDGIREPYTVGTPTEHYDLMFETDPAATTADRKAFFERTLPPILDDIIQNKVDPKVVDLVVADDPQGFITGMSPERLDDPSLGDVLSFDFDHRGAVPPTEADQPFVVTVEAIGDGKYLLGQTEILFLVPGWGRPTR